MYNSYWITISLRDRNEISQGRVQHKSFLDDLFQYSAAEGYSQLPFACQSSPGRTAACGIKDPAKDQFVREVDTAEQYETVLNLPNCWQADIEALLSPVAGDDSLPWHEEIYRHYEWRMIQRNSPASPAGAPEEKFIIDLKSMYDDESTKGDLGEYTGQISETDGASIKEFHEEIQKLIDEALQKQKNEEVRNKPNEKAILATGNYEEMGIEKMELTADQEPQANVHIAEAANEMKVNEFSDDSQDNEDNGGCSVYSGIDEFDPMTDDPIDPREMHRWEEFAAQYDWSKLSDTGDIYEPVPKEGVAIDIDSWLRNNVMSGNDYAMSEAGSSNGAPLHEHFYDAPEEVPDTKVIGASSAAAAAVDSISKEEEEEEVISITNDFIDFVISPLEETEEKPKTMLGKVWSFFGSR
ncbi:hypothetical protein M426DRAFT_262703 [Hypoxylon sp. CI-4A]|nr:hypothetical protein M426DRAFT_262703 [Hypoxylon sp. CI-4A]